MLELAILVSVVLMATVSIRRRSFGERTQEDSPDPIHVVNLPKAAAKPKLSNAWVRRICVLAAIGFAILFFSSLPSNKRVRWTSDCIPPTREERASWNYVHPSTALQNVSTNEVAQILFNQALLNRFGFSISVAKTLFSEALNLDQQCAMCHWGLAYSHAQFLNIVKMPKGTRVPHYSEEMYSRGKTEIQKASSMQTTNEKQRRYINAMTFRFPEIDSWDSFDQDYWEFCFAAAMLKIYSLDRSDLVAGAMACEALMHIIPWDYYLLDDSPEESFSEDITWKNLIDHLFPDKDGTHFNQVTGWSVDDKILAGFDLQGSETKIEDPRMKKLARVVEHLLLTVLQEDPYHPLATHLHIHLAEASQGDNPRTALKSADSLASASESWVIPHLSHMPSHIYARIGQFDKAIKSNEVAHEKDILVSESCLPPYVPQHNVDVLISSAMLGGNLEKAVHYSIVLRRLREIVKQATFIGAGWDYVNLLMVLGLFGRWEEILEAGKPTEGARWLSRNDGFEYSTATYHFYRYMAMTHMSPLDKSEAEWEWEQFIKIGMKIEEMPATRPATGIGLYGSPYNGNVKINSLYGRARNASLRGDLESAIELIKESIPIERSLGYMEPPWVPQPGKQCLGYLQYVAGHLDEAGKTFKEDLVDNPGNPWSMIGLYQVLEARQLDKEAAEIKINIEEVELPCSCPMLRITL